MEGRLQHRSLILRHLNFRLMASISSLKDRPGLQALSSWPSGGFADSLVCPPVPQDVLMYVDVKVFV